MSLNTLARIQEKLLNAHITFKHITHKTIPKDSAGASLLRGTRHEQGAKALILQAKSGSFLQVILPAHQRISLKKLKNIIQEKNVALAHPDEVFELTDCIVGSVPPFGILWNIDVYVDKSLLLIDEVVFSAGTLEDSIFITPEDLASINKAIIVDIISEKF